MLHFPRLVSIIRAGGIPRSVHRLRRLWQRVVRPLTVGVRALAVDGTGRVLLVRHTYIPGWHLPGGRVDKGETAAAAAARELREETGLSADGPFRLLGLYGRFSHGGSDHVAVYVVSAGGGTVCADGLEIAEARFFPLDTLPEDTAPATCRRIAEYRGVVVTAELW
ncbi:MAG: NUDIX domain-containing protein [Rhodospirillaceae bacterium]